MSHFPSDDRRPLSTPEEQAENIIDGLQDDSELEQFGKLANEALDDLPGEPTNLELRKIWTDYIYSEPQSQRDTELGKRINTYIKDYADKKAGFNV